jgi:hypothetical protein
MGLGYETGQLITIYLLKDTLIITVPFGILVIFIYSDPFGAQEIYYTPNNHNEINWELKSTKAIKQKIMDLYLGIDIHS